MAKIVASRYKIEAELGSGGMGTVYKGFDTESNQTVAIKQLHPKLSETHRTLQTGRGSTPRPESS